MTSGRESPENNKNHYIFIKKMYICMYIQYKNLIIITIRYTRLLAINLFIFEYNFIIKKLSLVTVC